MGKEVRREQRFQIGGNAGRLEAARPSRAPCGFGKLRKLNQARSGAAKTAGYVEQVARPRAGAEQGLAVLNHTGKDDIRDGDRRLSQIAACQRGPMGLGESEKSIEEAIHPGAPRFCVLDEIGGQTERKKCRDGPRTHRGQVAEAARESTMADCLGSVPVEAKVAAGDGEIGGDGQLLAWAEAKQGAVVANAQPQPGSGRFGRASANSGEQGQLTRLAKTPWIRPHLLRI
jgi:hypothetical protein